jgi:hypothetical protein
MMKKSRREKERAIGRLSNDDPDEIDVSSEVVEIPLPEDGSAEDVEPVTPPKGGARLDTASPVVDVHYGQPVEGD